MEKVRLGSTGIVVSKNGFGALPIQRISKEDAVFLLRKAYANGMDFFDTARIYSDSEEKVGAALASVRDKVIIASKTAAKDAESFWKDLDTSLKLLQTDHLDIYQFHNPSFCPKPGDGTGLYEAMLEAKAKGMIHHIGITNHKLKIAHEIIDSGLYETLQFPFSYISSEQDIALVRKCKEKNMGFIGMKGLSGGLLTNSKACYAFASQFDNLVPIWGIQREKELDEWLSYNENPPVLDDAMKVLIEKDKKELSGEFCRGCGYCLPCPVGIQINTCARMIQMVRRSPSAEFFSEESKAMMLNIHNCLKCGQCMKRCPYGLPIPTLLEKNLKDYEAILSGKVQVSVTTDART